MWLVRHVAWLMTRNNIGREGCSPFRRIFGKPCEGSVGKFGEQVHYKLSCRPTSMGARRLDWQAGIDGRALSRDLCRHQGQQNDLPVAEEPMLQQRRLGSHCGDPKEPQA